MSVITSLELVTDRKSDLPIFTMKYITLIRKMDSAFEDPNFTIEEFKCLQKEICDLEKDMFKQFIEGD